MGSCILKDINSVGYVVSDVLCIKECIGPSTGENIFNTIDKEFEDRKIPWKNCLGFACDNASVMTGVHAGVASFVMKEPTSMDVPVNSFGC